jgi:hypothetical protein
MFLFFVVFGVGSRLGGYFWILIFVDLELKVKLGDGGWEFNSEIG